MSETIHVYPLNDTDEHTTDGEDGHIGKCKCAPRVEWEGFTRIVVHNSFDGRELLEQKFSEVTL
jgi:hypothetical protein